MSTTVIQRADQLELLVARIRETVGAHADWTETAHLVADQLRAHLPGPEVLTGLPGTRCTSNPTGRSRSPRWFGAPAS